MWKITGLLSASSSYVTCTDGLLYALGPSKIATTGSIEKTYTGLATHNIIYFGMTVGLCGVWQSSDSFTVVIGSYSTSFAIGSAVASKASASCNGVTCLLTALVGKSLHSANTVNVKISWSFQGNGSPAPAFTVKDVSLSFATKTADDIQEMYLTIGDSAVPGSTKCYATEYWDASSSSCKTCATNCFSCFGASTNQCYKPSFEVSFDGTNLFTCSASSNCRNCYSTASNACYLCAHNYALTVGGTCTSSCPSGYTAYGDATAAACFPTCTSSQFLLYNETCVNSCDAPLVSGTNTEGKTCSYPCGLPSNTYLAWNGSCLSSCPYYQRIENYYQFCDVCQPGYYMYDNGTCLSSCYSSFTPSTIGGSMFCKYPCASASNYLYQNGSCIASCQTAFISYTEGSFKFCNYPCITGKFLYVNGSCMATCETLFNQRTEGTYKFCDYPCTSGQYLYANSSCMTTCQTSFNQRTEGTNKFCDYPCTSGQYLYANSSCMTTCQALFKSRTEGTSKFCDYPCPYTQFLYPNSSCIATCMQIVKPHLA